MTRQEVIEKVQKLLALTRSDNEHEAALAAARAQALMEKHQIAMADVGDSEGPEPVGFFTGFGPSLTKRSAWQWALAKTVARACGCDVAYVGKTGRILIVGRRSDVEIAARIRSWCHHEIDRLTAQVCRNMGRAWGKGFRLGCVAAIHRAIEAERQATQEEMRRAGASERALAVVDTRFQEAEEAMGKTKSISGPSMDVDGLAFRMGLVAGQHIWNGTRPRLDDSDSRS